ncbi:MAG TPA: MipA/OmpV family protein [Burkholderiaceae bacterium]|nr:MipA/OmpV family protein [Burkholderiaceae bacterium]
MRKPRLWLLGAMLCMTAAAQAQMTEPLWEAGVGAGMMALPDYRGSDQGKTYVFPIPYFVYNGERFRVDRGGIHGDIAQEGNVWLDVSMNLGPPADSENNAARVGMPDLDSTIEVGPSLRILLTASERGDRTLTLYMPARAVIATDFSHTKYIGWVFAPHLTYDHRNLYTSGWNVSVSLGPIYATEKYHDYYYEVPAQFASATRPAYDADGGYSGARSTLTVSKRFADWWVGGFLRYDRLDNATFLDSPLVRKDSSFMAGFGVAWIFARSAERVPVRKLPGG